MKRQAAVIFVVCALDSAVVILAFTQVQLSALRESRELETFLATQAKRLLIYRDSRNGIAPAPSSLQDSIAQGDILYVTDCAMCHGSDGHTLSDNGHWMYPRASDLTSPSCATLQRSRSLLDHRKWDSGSVVWTDGNFACSGSPFRDQR
ncbi:MAG TPA: hypothetical protein VE641_01290 [Chthoniobacterales bacterium]|nr:hypothetical protein [Chthoniobacterales bacterium]